MGKSYFIIPDVCTLYDENGKRRQFSTGQFTREEAYKECYKRLSEGKIVQKSRLIFSEYTKNWFINGKCPYYTVREAKGRVYSKSSIDNKLLSLNKHLIPTFGNMKLDHITTLTVEEWLKKKL